MTAPPNGRELATPPGSLRGVRGRSEEGVEARLFRAPMAGPGLPEHGPPRKTGERAERVPDLQVGFPRGKHRAFGSGHASGKCFLEQRSSEQLRTADWWLSCGPKTVGGTGQSRHPTFLVRTFRSGVKRP